MAATTKNIPRPPIPPPSVASLYAPRPSPQRPARSLRIRPILDSVELPCEPGCKARLYSQLLPTSLVQPFTAAMNNYSYDDDPHLQEILEIQRREENLRKLMNETQCEIIQENGQRKLGGPPPSKYHVYNIVLYCCIWSKLVMPSAHTFW